MKRIISTFLGAFLLFASCAHTPTIEVGSTSILHKGMREIICLVDSEELAIAAAEGYGVVFKHFNEGVAVFETEDSLYDVQERGKALDLPPVLANNIYEGS